MTPAQAISHLKAYGMTEAAIAAEVGCGQSTINRIGSGAREASWRIGSALVALATSKRRIGRKRAA